MPKQLTIRERLIAAIEARGGTAVPSRSSKWIAYARPDKPGSLFFLGKYGGLRTGRVFSASISLEGPYKDRLLTEYEALPKKA